ncbi:hypothetical protein [Rhizobium sp. NPDC090279]|uniref:hypothetical protein n=1 Tax=Rhizobium sp. NPDC090279 TaxID=3364499 RepID=UPI00383B0236
MPHAPLKTIVFLPAVAAEFVAANLRQSGYQATSVQTLSQLHAAMCSCDYVLAVTTRPNIDLVRHIQTIPVVNIEVFFDLAVDHRRDDTPKRFDAKSFIRRVTALTSSPQSTRTSAHVPKSATSSTISPFIGFVAHFMGTVMRKRQRHTVAK